jgi:hypothetical protein
MDTTPEYFYNGTKEKTNTIIDLYSSAEECIYSKQISQQRIFINLCVAAVQQAFAFD